jgi:hypothetical protein
MASIKINISYYLAISVPHYIITNGFAPIYSRLQVVPVCKEKKNDEEQQK